jgi:hypothetical protein
MRMQLPILALLLGACATSVGTGRTAMGDVDISLRPAEKPGSELALKIANRSAGPLCFMADVLQNPSSYQVILALRDRNGRVVRQTERGYPSPWPLQEVVRLEPGESVLARYTLQGRFDRPIEEGWSVRVELPYGNCEDPHPRCDPRYVSDSCIDRWSRRGRSSWEPL